MAENANRQFEVYKLDVDIEKSLLQHHPVPPTIQRVKVADDFL